MRRILRVVAMIIYVLWRGTAPGYLLLAVMKQMLGAERRGAVMTGVSASWATVSTETVARTRSGTGRGSDVLSCGRRRSVESPPPPQSNI